MPAGIRNESRSCHRSGRLCKHCFSADLLGTDLLAEVVYIHGTAEEPALCIAHSVFGEIDGLRFSFNTLSNHLKLKRVGHLDNVRHHLAGGAIGSDGIDK